MISVPFSDSSVKGVGPGGGDGMLILNNME